MSSHEHPDQERRGPSGLTMLELAELLPPLRPLPLPPLSAMAPTPTLWRVIPRLLFSIAFGALATMHAVFYLLRGDEPFNQARCLEALSSTSVYVIAAVLCALGGASLLSKLKQLLRDRRNRPRTSLRSPEPG